MNLPVLDFKNKIVGKLRVNFLNIKKIRYDLIQESVLWQQSKKRCAISNTKEITAVKGSTKKIYRQKGTGRARHGSVRGAQFVGGGIIFGPSNRKVYNYKINKKVKKAAILNALSLKYKSESIIIYKCLKVKTKKTKDFLQMHVDNFISKASLLIDSSFDSNIINSTNNVKFINRLSIFGINALDLITHEKLFFSEEAFKIFVQKFNL